MKENIIEARIKRNGLVGLAGDHYRDVSSQIIKDLKSCGKSPIIGIQRNDNVYTIIGEKYVYYLTETGAEGQISHEGLLEILRKNALKLGKTGNFQFVKINEYDSIWVLNVETMNAMWNTILLFTAIE